MDKPGDIKPEREDYLSALRELDIYTDIMVEDIMDIHTRAAKFARLRVVEGLRVGKLMSQPVTTVAPDCSLGKAAHLLLSKKISGLPVVDAQQQLVGIITEADFLHALGVPSHHPAHNLWQTLEAMFTHGLETTTAEEGHVSDLMTTDVVTLSADHTLHELLAEMKRNRVKRIVVCDDDRHVIGIVTRSDLVRVFFDRLARSEQPPGQ